MNTIKPILLEAKIYHCRLRDKIKTETHTRQIQKISQNQHEVKVGVYNLLSTTRRICPKYGEIQTGMYFFVYTGAPVLWIMSVKNFRFFNNISESMQLTNMYNMLLERCYCSASADVCCIRIHAEMTEILQVKD